MAASVLVVLEPIVAPCSAQLIAGTSDDTVAVDDVDDILSGTHAPPLLPLTSFTLFLLLLLLLLLMPLDLPDTWQVNTRHINSASNRIVRVYWSTCAVEKREKQRWSKYLLALVTSKCLRAKGTSLRPCSAHTTTVKLLTVQVFWRKEDRP